MKLRGIIQLLSLLLIAPSGVGGETIDLLESDWDTAISQAREENKHLLVAFLGDGWSVGSKQFESGILETEPFQEFAAEKLIYCPVRARHVQKMDKKAAARLQSLVIYFDVEHYPTILLLAPDESEILRHGYKDLDAKTYVALLKAILPPDA